MWQLRLFVLELNVNTPVEASKCLGPGNGEGKLCSRRSLCCRSRLASQVFRDARPLVFFLNCNWEWGKGSFAERHDVFNARKKKRQKKKKKKSPESPQRFSALPQTPLEALEHVTESLSRATACRDTCNPTTGMGPVPAPHRQRVHGEPTGQNCGNLSMVSVESTSIRIQITDELKGKCRSLP